MAATNYSSIKSMSASFKTMLSNQEIPYPFSVQDTSMVVLVDLENDLGDILAANPAKLAIILGTYENALTVCILGADSEGQVLPAHLNASLDGQETWPEEKQIKFSDDSSYDNFFV